MFFWKVDDETIRCLINKQEIGNMGFDVNEIAKDENLMKDFLDAIIESSRDYVQWDTGNGVQNFNAKALPADQFLLTISCTYMDDAIDKDLAQILKMTSALNHRISEERLRHILALSGREKEEAFRSLTRDLTEVCTGQLAEALDPEQDPEQPRLRFGDNGELLTEETASAPGDALTSDTPAEAKSQPAVSRKLIYQSFDKLAEFCDLIKGRYRTKSDLFQFWDMYVLVVVFEEGTDERDVETFAATALEHGADISDVLYEQSFLGEHGKTMMIGNAIEQLAAFA